MLWLNMDLGMLGATVLGVSAALLVAWRLFFTWYRHKREADHERWRQRTPAV